MVPRMVPCVPETASGSARISEPGVCGQIVHPRDDVRVGRQPAMPLLPRLFEKSRLPSDLVSHQGDVKRCTDVGIVEVDLEQALDLGEPVVEDRPRDVKARSRLGLADRMVEQRAQGIEQPRAAVACLMFAQCVQLPGDEQPHPLVLPEQGQQAAQVYVLEPMYGMVPRTRAHRLHHVLGLAQCPLRLSGPVGGPSSADHDRVPTADTGRQLLDCPFRVGGLREREELRTSLSISHTSAGTRSSWVA